MSTTETSRNWKRFNPRKREKKAKNRPNSVKLATMPSTITSGRSRWWPRLEPSMIGSRLMMQGAIMVSTPEARARAMRLRSGVSIGRDEL